jgi:hypothetical protein
MLITRYLLDLGCAASGELFGCGTGVSYGEQARGERTVCFARQIEAGPSLRSG